MTDSVAELLQAVSAVATHGNVVIGCQSACSQPVLIMLL